MSHRHTYWACFSKGIKSYVLYSLFLLVPFISLAQPANDNCSTPSVINIANGGYGFGTFTSTQHDISQATVQSGETFAPAILVASQTQKSIWYKFSLPTTRSVRVTLAQPASAIQAGDIGYAVYKTNTCLPVNDSLSTKLTPIALFGSTYHPCVEAGEYLVQVSANSNANGPVYIELKILDSSGAAYDHPTNGYDFGLLSNGAYVRSVDYQIECQSLEDGSEVCNTLGTAEEYTKSTWHTFKTPSYFDYVSVLFAHPNGNFGGTPKIGYKLYKGDARITPMSSLMVVRDCDSFKTSGFYPDRRVYRCDELDTGTVYSIQLFFPRTFTNSVRFSVAYDGSGPTQAPVPVLSSIPATNALGSLPYNPVGIETQANDKLACNSVHAGHPCDPSLPAQGVFFNGTRYNLSTFFTFTLDATSRLNIRGEGVYPSCYNPMLMRLYSQGVSTNCATLDTVNIVAQFYSNSNFSINCMPPGNYTLQVLGSDTAAPLTNIHYGYLYNNAPPLCLFNNLSQRLRIYINVANVKSINKFSLNVTGAVDSVNVGSGAIQPMVLGTTYQAQIDTFGCSQTLLPDTVCGTGYKKAMYREMKVADSGYVNINASSSYNLINYMLMKGSASALATAQNVNNFPDKINGLTRWSECRNYFGNYCYGGERVCVVPGDYTFVSFGGDNVIGFTDKPNFTAGTTTTVHYAPSLAEDFGNVLDSVGPNGGSRVSSADYFSCKDNADTINGYAPCSFGGKPATKAIYRQFYLKDPAVVQVSGYYTYCGGYGTYGGLMTLFNGKATDGLNTLTPVADRWKCFQNQTVPDLCTPLPAGWYTVVSYGAGPSYGSPVRDVNNGPMGYSNYVGMKDQVTITVTKSCPGPKYNRPYKAAVDIVSHQPFLIEWAPRVGHTAAYPKTDTTYILPQEDFNCTVDTPYSGHPINACATGMNKVVYYVFRTTQESYVQIDTKGYWASVYNKDVRLDSARFDTLAAIQPCMQTSGYIQLCRLQPGTYTLVIFAQNSTSCTNVQPTVYIDRVGYSRFDFANNAYDFGSVAPDSAWHNGKAGDVNPLDASRAPSNDFFFCTTGANPTEPTASSCGTAYNANIYNPQVNNPLYTNNTNGTDIPRRTLWYTFVTDQGGYVRIKVANNTIGKNYIYRFAVYKSNVDGTLPFNTVVANGQVDSTGSQGLVLVASNPTYYYCSTTINEISFYREPCSAIAERYYIVVENTNSWPYEVPGMKPTGQTEVSILIDSVQSIQPLFDHYSSAYNFGTVGQGSYTGATDNFSCASRDASDPVYASLSNCNKNVWYKFTTNVTGIVRSRMVVNGISEYNYDHIQLFRQIVPGDSTSTGLQFQGYSHQYDSGYYYTQSCIYPGTYYILLPGCYRVNEYVYPVVKIYEQAGDFCSAPVAAPLPGPGTNTATVTVNCHTIGTDYGEFNPLLTCPANTPRATYKSSWFRIDIGGTDTLDVTAFLNESTTANSSEIKYRLMTGNCGAMQEQSCVQDALTQNTYKCLVPGSYYLQLFSPVSTTGTIDLKLSAIKHADTCAPLNNCLANANFIPQFDCTSGDSVRFVNYSTYGSSIQYTWNFGYNGKTSTEVAPAFFYPALTTSQTYTVTLNTKNVSCNGQNNATAQVTIPARPYFNLGKDTALCEGGSIVLDATTHAGATYQWSNGATTPTITVNSNGVNTYWAKATYNNCVKRDTITVSINPIVGRRQGKVLCGNDSIQLSSYRGYNESYLWSNGSTNNNIYASVPGTYYCDVKLYGCTKRDTFNVTGIIYPFTSDSLQACFTSSKPYILNAATPGAQSYSWQNGAGGATFNVTSVGLYWVNVSFGSCSVRDSIIVSNLQAAQRNDSLSICTGQSYTLPSGSIITGAGLYNDTLRNLVGCDSLIAHIKVSVQPIARTNAAASICQGQSYTLPWGTSVNTPGLYSDTTHSTAGCDSLIRSVTISQYVASFAAANPVVCAGQSYTLPSGLSVTGTGIYKDTLHYVSGCDSLITTVNLTVKPVANASLNPIICEGQSYKLPSGASISAAGNYQDTLHYISGCDSLRFTINLTVKPVTRRSSSTAICVGQSYTMPSGQVINSSGIYKDTLHYTSGCDSLISTINLTVKQVSRVANAAIVCAGQSYTLPSGNVVSASGIYQDTLRYASGCDSVITTMNLAVRTLTRRATNNTICAGQSFTMPSGAVVAATGIYIDTLHYISPVCDSVITTINLTVKPVSRVNKATAICAGQSYTLPAGTVVNASGVYTDTLHYTSGCDSLISTTSLTVKSVSRIAAAAIVCAGQSYTLPSGKIVTASGIYQDTLHYASGCDSVITTMNLAVRTLTRRATNNTICGGQNFTMPSGAVVTATGIYIDTLHYVSPVCDSIITTVNLTVKPVSRVNRAAAICAGQSYTLPTGTVVNVTGTYTDTLHYANGCDSIITTTAVTIKNVTRRALTASICAGQSFTLPSGVVVNAAGAYQDTLHYVAGCDSVISNITLGVNTSINTNATATICQGQVYNFAWGATATAAGIYRDTLRGATGCDSIIRIVTLSVTPRPAMGINPPIASVCDGDSLRLSAFGGTGYQWIQGSGILSPNTAATWIYPPQAGNYEVSIFDPICNTIDTFRSIVSIDPLPQISIAKSNNITCIQGSAQLVASGGSRYVWYPITGLNNATIPNPIAAPAGTMVYHVQAISNKNCAAEDSIEVQVIKGDGGLGYFVASAFTPDGDGKNDCFGVRTWGAVTELHFNIYDRYGLLVFTTADPSKCWDGTYKGTKLDPAAFIYIISANTICGPIIRKGTVVLIR